MSKIISNTDGDFQLSYHLEDMDRLAHDNTYRTEIAVHDLFSFMKENMIPKAQILVIDDLYVNPKKRANGIGKRELRKLASKHSDKIILLMSGASGKEYSEEPSESEFKEILSNLRQFYQKVGFVNINDIIGHYQFRETFIYVNSAALPFLKKLK